MIAKAALITVHHHFEPHYIITKHHYSQPLITIHHCSQPLITSNHHYEHLTRLFLRFLAAIDPLSLKLVDTSCDFLTETPQQSLGPGFG